MRKNGCFAEKFKNSDTSRELVNALVPSTSLPARCAIPYKAVGAVIVERCNGAALSRNDVRRTRFPRIDFLYIRAQSTTRKVARLGSRRRSLKRGSFDSVLIDRPAYTFRGYIEELPTTSNVRAETLDRRSVFFFLRFTYFTIRRTILQFIVSAWLIVYLFHSQWFKVLPYLLQKWSRVLTSHSFFQTHCNFIYHSTVKIRSIAESMRSSFPSVAFPTERALLILAVRWIASHKHSVSHFEF